MVPSKNYATQTQAPPKLNQSIPNTTSQNITIYQYAFFIEKRSWMAKRVHMDRQRAKGTTKDVTLTIGGHNSGQTMHEGHRDQK